ncbi:MAG: hypothetical protein AABX85_01425 [Nanoarchaeota archaeon]
MSKKTCIKCNHEFNGIRNSRYCDICLKRFGNDSTKRRMIRNRNFIKNYKKDKECELCGYKKYPEILEFHHKNKKIKSEGINHLMKSLKELKIINSEIKKCSLICPNCHRELHLIEEYNKNEI